MSEGEHAEAVEEVAAELAAHGVPERRAHIVALAAETDLTYEGIADRLDVASKGSVGNQVREYRETRRNAEWLAEHGPDI